MTLCKDIVEFDGCMQTLDDVVNVANKTRSKCGKLETELVKKRGKSTALDRTITKKESHIKTLNEHVPQFLKNTVATIQKETEETLTKFNTSFEYHDITIRARFDNMLNNLESDLKEIPLNTKDALKEFLLMSNAEAKLSFLEPLYYVSTEGKGDQNKVPLSLINLLNGLEIWAENNSTSYVLKSKN